MEEKRALVIYSVIKAVLTTSLLFGAAIQIAEIIKLPYEAGVTTGLIILVISILMTGFYINGLVKKGAIDPKHNYLKDFLQTFSSDWNDNVEILFSSWGKSLGICLFVILNISMAIVVTYSIIVAPIGGLAFAYMARRENKPVMYFGYGYLAGMGSIICGLIITYLTGIFGAVLVWGFILTDAVITGIYTYLDLKEWEHEQNLNIEKAKIKEGLK